MKTYLGHNKKWNQVNNIFIKWVRKNMNDWAAQNKSFKKYDFQKFYIAVKHLDLYFLTFKKKVLMCTFREMWCIQIQMYPKTFIEPKYGAFNLRNKVSSHGLGLLLQLCWRFWRADFWHCCC